MVPDTNSISINELPGVATSHNNVEYCFNYSKFNHVVLQIKLVKFLLKFQLSYLHTKRPLTVFNFVSLLMILTPNLSFAFFLVPQRVRCRHLNIRAYGIFVIFFSENIIYFHFFTVLYCTK